MAGGESDAARRLSERSPRSGEDEEDNDDRRPGGAADDATSGASAAAGDALAGSNPASSSAMTSSAAAATAAAPVSSSGVTTTTSTPALLNLYQKVSVLRTGDDTLAYGDAQGRLKSVKVRELGDIIHKATPLEQKKAKLDIPVPQINAVATYKRDVPANYGLPNSYVRFQKTLPEEWVARVDYVADAEDEQWLGGKAGLWRGPSRERSSPPSVTLDMLEVMMDTLEKATGFETIVTFAQAEALLLHRQPQLYRLFPIKRPRQQQASAQSQHQPSSASSSPSPVTLKQVLSDVYQYWVQKRSKLKRPLLRRFWPVTPTDDTNPHLVFRPREKEKYKLRKKRQNDFDAYLKIKQLRSDFDNLRAVAELVARREELSRLHLRCHVQVFRERLRDATDTSLTSARRRQRRGSPPPLLRALLPEHWDPSVDEAEEEAGRLLSSADLHVPLHFDTTGRKARRVRPDESDAPGAAGSGSGIAPAPHDRDPTAGGGGSGSSAVAAGGAVGPSGGDPSSAVPERGSNVAGRNYGEPAPLFLHPLSTREALATTWEGAVPHVPSYRETHPAPVHRFRHRPRVGRGGRICIDRMPVDPTPGDGGHVYYTAGPPLPMPEKARLLDLLPRPINYPHASQRIQELVLRDEVAGDEQENDGEEVVVDLDAWLATDEPQWGEERFAIGPI